MTAVAIHDTIEVQGYFGPRRVTKQDYVKQWQDHVRELYKLTPSLESEDYTFIRDLVTQAAMMEFDRISENEK